MQITEAMMSEMSRIAGDTVRMELDGLGQIADSLARQAAEMPQGSTIRVNHTNLLARVHAAQAMLAGNREFWPLVSGRALKMAHSEIRAAEG